MLILGLLGMYFDAAVVFVMNSSLFFQIGCGGGPNCGFKLQNFRLHVEILQNCLWMLSINVQLGFWFQPMVGLKVTT